jgi:hypothetical protein
VHKKLLLLFCISSSLTLNSFGRFSTLLLRTVRSCSTKTSNKVLPKEPLREKEVKIKGLAQRIRQANKAFIYSHNSDSALGNYLYLRRLNKEMFELKYLKKEKEVVTKTTPKKASPTYPKAEIGEYYE